MTARFRAAFGAVCVIALTAACGPAETKKPAADTAADASASNGADAITPRNPYFGTWEIASAKVAPWWDQKGATPEANHDLATITFAADKASGGPLLNCDKPRYAVDIAPVRNLFEGNLPDPAKQAAEMGFKGADIDTMNFSCIDGSKDVSLDFPMVDKNTIMLGLDNVVYTFKRKGG